MKKIFCFSILSLCGVVVFAQDNLSAQKVLENLSAKLNSIKTIRYDYHWITNWPSQRNYQDIFGKVYLNYSTAAHSKESNNNPYMVANKLDYTYQVTDKDDFPIDVNNGNGKEFFSINKKDTSMHVVRQSYGNYSALYFFNSLVTFRKGLPLIIADTTTQTTLSDTVIDNKNYYLLFIVLKNKSLVGGRFIPNRLSFEVDTHYEIAIDKKTFLPLFIKQPSLSARHPNDYFLTEFTNYDFNYKPKENTWLYSTYEKDYKVNFTDH